MFELAVLIISILSALFTYEIGTVRNKGAVRASAISGLVFGLPVYLAPAAGIAVGAFAPIPAAAMGASFAGMSSIKAVPSRLWIAASAAIFSGIFLFSSPAFAGNGGGLGISAFISVIATIGIRKTATEFGKILAKKSSAH
ncbi:MAG: hypothetical protein KKB25_02120 [Nanoarchaeota archaeon]|nr:hypothetical protein [Nanoarchaeota archaeon]